MSTATRPNLLLLELWGLGDLTVLTTILPAAAESYDITLVGKPHARPLLEPSFPGIEFLSYDAPWTAFRNKYQLLNWNWRELGLLLKELRGRRFQAAVSVRKDPRDHLFMHLVGARQRYGLPVKGSGIFLTHRIPPSFVKQHKVEDWRQLGEALGLPGMETAAPRFEHSRYRSPRIEEMFAKVERPMVCLHPGARIPVRRWPEEYFGYVIAQMRKEFDFHLAVVPDPDGYGASLARFADTVLPSLTIPELVDVLGRSDLVLCNDSGPGHIAAACGRPVIVVLGPAEPYSFRPWGDQHAVVIRDICPLRPCFDYCQFPEPYCLTKLLPDDAWPEMRNHLHALLERGQIRQAFLKQ